MNGTEKYWAELLRPGEEFADGASPRLLIAFWPTEEAEQISHLLLWQDRKPESYNGLRGVFTFAGRLADDYEIRRVEMREVLGNVPMLDRPEQPKLFLVLCRSSGGRPSPEQITGHRVNSARNFERLLVALTLSRTDDPAAIDCTAYLYEAEDLVDVRAMVNADPLVEAGNLNYQVFGALFLSSEAHRFPAD